MLVMLLLILNAIKTHSTILKQQETIIALKTSKANAAETTQLRRGQMMTNNDNDRHETNSSDIERIAVALFSTTLRP